MEHTTYAKFTVGTQIVHISSNAIRFGYVSGPNRNGSSPCRFWTIEVNAEEQIANLSLDLSEPPVMVPTSQIVKLEINLVPPSVIDSILLRPATDFYLLKIRMPVRLEHYVPRHHDRVLS